MIILKLGPFLNKSGLSELNRLFQKHDSLETNQTDIALPEHPYKEEDNFPLNEFKNRILKRCFDFIFSFVFLLLLACTIFPVIALIIKLTSPGPIFFGQERTGYKNKVFKMWKFRSMTVNEECDKVQSMKNDCRITPFGAFLRRTSLDELPQFYNVLIGDMAVVGPRPHMLEHTKEYAPLVDDYLDRHEAKPGVTGWAQISGYRGPTDELWKMEKRVEYDLWYIKNYNFLLDIRCVLKTIVTVAGPEENAH